MAIFDFSAIQSQLELLQERALLYSLTLEPLFLAADEFYFADLNPKPNSPVSGLAVFGYDADTDRLAVAVSAQGLEPNQPHVQHIHGFVSGQEAVEPTLAADTDGDGYIEGAEGGPFWGPVMLGLPTVNTPDGEMFVVETFQLPAGTLGADPQLELREYNIHGITTPAGAGAGTPGEVNGVGGYKPGLVVAGGDVNAVGSPAELLALIQESGFDDLAGEALRERLASAASGWFVWS